MRDSGFFDIQSSGLGASIGSDLVKGIIGTVGTKAPGVPAPMDLYNEAAPRIIRGLKQYDAASPLIDFATENWWLLVLGLTAIAVGGSYLGNVIYHKLHKGGSR